MAKDRPGQPRKPRNALITIDDRKNKAVSEFQEWMLKKLPINGYGDLRKYLNQLMYGVQIGGIARADANAITYMASVMIVALDRERQHEVTPTDELAALQDKYGGEVHLSQEQAIEVLKLAANPRLQIKVLTEHIERNKNVVNVEQVVEVDAEKQVKEEIKTFLEDNFAL